VKAFILIPLKIHFMFKFSVNHITVSFFVGLFLVQLSAKTQVKWLSVDADYGPLPKGFHVFKTTDSLEGKPFVAYYTVANLKKKKLIFTTDTTFQRRLSPAGFYEKNNKPLLVVNCTFFSFATNLNLNIVIKNGQVISYNTHSITLKGKDTFQYKHPFASAIGISKKRTADVAWTYTDSSLTTSYAIERPIFALKDSFNFFPFKKAYFLTDNLAKDRFELNKWNMQTAVGGGPVLVQNGQIKVTNNEEMKFSGKAINDLHPRTLMGYTKDNKIIVMVIEGRNPGIADGATLTQAAQLMVNLGCLEALNLDGGGSSCMLINGKETIKPSDKGMQRPVPAVFIIQRKSK
jgi:hypothetical protein